MAKRHLKRLDTPKTWQIKKKGTSFITRPNPGGQKMSLSMPVSTVLKSMTNSANTTREVKKLLTKEKVLVNERRVNDDKYPVGLFDVIKPGKQAFRIVLNSKGKLAAIEIPDKESKSRISRISGKISAGKRKFQINLSDGRNIITDKADFRLGDSLLIELPSQKIINHFRLEKGASVLLFAGKHIAKQGIVESIDGKRIIFKDSEGNSITTSIIYAIVTGKEKPALTTS